MRALRWLPALAVPLAGCAPRLVVDVVAFQWNWQFDYPDSGVRVTGVKGRPAELVPPVGQPVHPFALGLGLTIALTGLVFGCWPLLLPAATAGARDRATGRTRARHHAKGAP